MARCICPWILLSVVCHASGTSLRAPSPDYVDLATDALEKKNAEQVLFGLNEKTGAALSSAQASSSRAASAMLHAEALSGQSQTRLTALQDMLRGATVAGENAATANEQAVASLKHMKSYAVQAVQDSKSSAVVAVQELLKAKYQELDGWKKGVLIDPFENAQSARAEALEASNAKLHTLYSRMGTYQPGIEPMQRQAKTLIAGAAARAKEAQSKYAYDPYGALQDMSAARSMQKQGTELANTAATLHNTVWNLGQQIQATVAERNAAVMAAEQYANPNGLPPQPVNPNFAYAPPPPR